MKILSKIIIAVIILWSNAAVSQLPVIKTFEFGPGTPQSFAHFRTLFAPAGVMVGVKVDVDVNEPWRTVVVDVFDSDQNSIGTTGPNGPLRKSVEIQGRGSTTFSSGTNSSVTFINSFGCPCSFRVRVRTANNQPPSTRVAGNITFIFSNPSSVKLDMEGGTVQLASGSQTSKKLTQVAKTIIPKGTGTFTIKAKWHTDPLDFSNFGGFFPLTVKIIKPNGTVATSGIFLSQHVKDEDITNIFRCLLTYNVTREDVLQTGDWKLNIINNSAVKIVDFDIEKGLDVNSPPFTSAFRLRCF